MRRRGFVFVNSYGGVIESEDESIHLFAIKKIAEKRRKFLNSKGFPTKEFLYLQPVWLEWKKKERII